MPTGKVKWFDPKKGYGFIIGEQGQDVFVHYTSITGSGFRVLKDGEEVEYELVKGDKGFQARNVAHTAVPAPAKQPCRRPAAGIGWLTTLVRWTVCATAVPLDESSSRVRGLFTLPQP